MATKSIKANFTLNFINTAVGLLYPVITFPYISRILQPEGVGLIQFLQSVINYFAMFAALGIPLYAVKVIAKYREDEEKRNIATTEILYLHFLLTLIVYTVLLFAGFAVEQFSDNILIYLILSTHLFLIVIGCDWFYQGVEDFKYITIRSLIVRLLSFIALFLFVRDRSDIYIYAVLIVIAEAGNCVINFIHLRSFLNVFRISFKKLNLKQHIKPALEIFLLNVIVSIYVNLDSVMLGFIETNEDVGYYAAATRITRALCGFSTALGAVVFPRLTNYYGQKNYVKFKDLAKDSVSFSLLVLVPVSVILMITAPILVPLFCGEAYTPGILTLQILSPILIMLGISSMLGTKVLYSMDLQRLVIICTGIGAITNFILNCILIPLLSYNGAAISSIIAETLVSSIMLYYAYKRVRISIFDKNMIQIIIGTLLVAISLLVFLRYIHLPDLIMMLLSGGIAFVIYIGYLSIVGNYYMTQAYKFIVNIKKSKR